MAQHTLRLPMFHCIICIMNLAVQFAPSVSQRSSENEQFLLNIREINITEVIVNIAKATFESFYECLCSKTARYCDIPLTYTTGRNFTAEKTLMLSNGSDVTAASNAFICELPFITEIVAGSQTCRNYDGENMIKKCITCTRMNEACIGCHSTQGSCSNIHITGGMCKEATLIWHERQIASFTTSSVLNGSKISACITDHFKAENQSSDTAGIIIGVIVCLVLVVAIILISYIIWRSRKNSTNHTSSSQLSSNLPVRADERGTKSDPAEQSATKNINYKILVLSDTHELVNDNFSLTKDVCNSDTSHTANNTVNTPDSHGHTLTDTNTKDRKYQNKFFLPTNNNTTLSSIQEDKVLSPDKQFCNLDSLSQEHDYSHLGKENRHLKSPYNMLLQPKEDPRVRSAITAPTPQESSSYSLAQLPFSETKIETGNPPEIIDLFPSPPLSHFPSSNTLTNDYDYPTDKALPGLSPSVVTDDDVESNPYSFIQDERSSSSHFTLEKITYSDKEKSKYQNIDTGNRECRDGNDEESPEYYYSQNDVRKKGEIRPSEEESPEYYYSQNDVRKNEKIRSNEESPEYY